MGCNVQASEKLSDSMLGKKVNKSNENRKFLVLARAH